MRNDEDLRRKVDDFSPFRADAERRMGVRDDDMAELPLFASPSHVEILRVEMTRRQHAALIQSTSWFELWRLSDAIVGFLEKTYWLRAHAKRTVEVAEVAEAGAGSAFAARRRTGVDSRRGSPALPFDAGDRFAWEANSADMNAAERRAGRRGARRLVRAGRSSRCR
jgi:hypothetical protein